MIYGEYEDGEDYDYNVVSNDNITRAEYLNPIIFVIGTFFLPLILLNIVIAIISDTYNRVKTSSKESDNKERNKVIL